MRPGLFLLAALLLFILGVTPVEQSPTTSVSQQVMSLRSMESTKASAATDIKIRPLREDKSNFYPWMMELKEALRGRGLLGALFPEDGEAAKIKVLEEKAAGDSETSKAKLELKRINEKNTVCYFLKNNVAAGIKSTLPYGGDPEALWKLLEPHRELFTLHDIDYRIMNLRLKDFNTGLDLINEAIRFYRPVEQQEEWKDALPERTVVGRLSISSQPMIT